MPPKLFIPLLHGVKNKKIQPLRYHDETHSSPSIDPFNSGIIFAHLFVLSENEVNVPTA